MLSDIFTQEQPPIDNLSSAVFTSDNLLVAMNRLKEFAEEPYVPQPTIKLVPLYWHLSETKYWIPYGNTAVPVNEEVVYKFIPHLQGYLRNKRQNVNCPRLIKL